jgi:hypothetical protein
MLSHLAKTEQWSYNIAELVILKFEFNKFETKSSSFILWWEFIILEQTMLYIEFTDINKENLENGFELEGSEAVVYWLPGTELSTPISWTYGWPGQCARPRAGSIGWSDRVRLVAVEQ